MVDTKLFVLTVGVLLIGIFMDFHLSNRTTKKENTMSEAEGSSSGALTIGGSRADAEAVGAKEGENGTDVHLFNYTAALGFNFAPENVRSPTNEIGWALEAAEVTSGDLTGYEDLSEKHSVDPKLLKSLEQQLHVKIHQYAFAYPQPPDNPEGAFVFYDKADKMVALRKLKGMGSDVKFQVYKHFADSDEPWHGKRTVACDMRPITTPLIAVEDAKMFCWEPECEVIAKDKYDKEEYHGHNVARRKQQGDKIQWKADQAKKVKSGCLVYQMIDDTYVAYTMNLMLLRLSTFMDAIAKTSNVPGQTTVQNLAGHLGPSSPLLMLLSSSFAIVGFHA